MDTGIIEYKLTTPLEMVADLNGGTIPIIKKVFLFAPTNKNLTESLRLEAYFTDTTKKIQEETAAKQAKETPEQSKARESKEAGIPVSEKEGAMTPKSLMMMLLMYCDNVEGLFEDFKGLITVADLKDTSGACFMDKNKTVPLTEHTYDNMSTKDTKGMIGEYLYHFLLEDYLGQES